MRQHHQWCGLERVFPHHPHHHWHGLVENSIRLIAPSLLLQANKRRFIGDVIGPIVLYMDILQPEVFAGIVENSISGAVRFAFVFSHDTDAQLMRKVPFKGPNDIGSFHVNTLTVSPDSIDGILAGACVNSSRVIGRY